MGLGINDPKGIFGTTTGLSKIFGNNRVIEPPTRKCFDRHMYWSGN